MTATAIPDTVATAGAPFGWRPVLAGFGVIAVFVGGMGAWLTLAPIESAVVAPGVVGVDSNVKTVQHLEGGIVEEILVHENDHVATGDLLVRLRNTLPASQLNEVQGQYFEARATDARLVAERDGDEAIRFPAELTNRADEPAIHDAMSGQQSIFDSRRALMSERTAILHRTVAGLQEKIAGLQEQFDAAERQRKLIAEQLEGATALLDRGLMDRPRVLELQQKEAELDGRIGSFRADIASAKQGVEEANLRFAELRADTTSEVVEQLRDVRSRAYELSQQLAAAQDVLARTEIRSPINGTVVGLKVHTIGGVISAGEPLMDIVPSDDELVVRASIDPRDIDEVHQGLPASVRLISLNHRVQTAIEAKVSTVSADRLVDPATGYGYYLARVQLLPDSPEMASVTLQPGMAADVLIRTGTRTPWDYLIAPIARNFTLSLREE
ncbi:MAG: HlyD family type I secretion periplasmic adaptor subunit [Rhodobacteraceae bacterium]|nr:HlyD family type I secretion periplasmic adaptor subunit [Paracoccaceae bacterium]